MAVDVLFVWELGGGLGHLVRLRTLAEAVKQHGLSVAMAVRNTRHCRTVLQETGIPWYQAPVKLGRSVQEIPTARTFADILYNIGFANADELFSLTLAWRNLIQLINPKMVVLDHSPTALLSLVGQAPKKVLVGTGFSCPPDCSPLPDLRPWLPADTTIHKTEVTVLQNMNEVLSHLQQHPLQRVSELYQQLDEVALITFPELDHFGARPNVRYWGSWDSDLGEPVQWPNHAGKKVFFYLKPAKMLEPLLRSLESQSMSAIVYVPEMNVEHVESWCGKNVNVLKQPASMGQIAHMCDFVVSNGTHGVVSRTLLAGKPVVNFPLHLEQLLLSRKIEKMSAGLTGSTEDPQQALQTVQQMLQENHYRRAAEVFAKRYHMLQPDIQPAKLANKLVASLNASF